MRKKLSILMTLALTLGVFLSSLCFVNAQSNSNRIVDGADLLSDYEEQQLELALADWCYTNQFDIVVVTNYNYYSQDTSENELMKYADDYYDYNGYGYGDNYDGCILVIDMGSRETWISTCGYGATALTDYGIERLQSDITSSLSKGYYYEAISDSFIDSVEWMYDQAKSGTPYDYSYDAPEFSEVAPGMFGCAFVPAGIIAFIMSRVKKGQLKSVRKKREAQSYVRPGSLNVTRHYERFMYSNVVATPRPKEDSGGGMGGSTMHTSSSGRRHGGGGGHF